MENASQNPAMALVIKSDRMGNGNDELGHLLMPKFLKTFADISPTPEYVLLYNSGVKLASEGSPVLADLKALELKGAAILSCGTCLEFFKIKDSLKVGRVSNMHEIVGAMTSVSKIVSP